jgi:hypothetical protein
MTVFTCGFDLGYSSSRVVYAKNKEELQYLAFTNRPSSIDSVVFLVVDEADAIPKFYLQADVFDPGAGAIPFLHLKKFIGKTSSVGASFLFCFARGFT